MDLIYWSVLILAVAVALWIVWRVVYEALEKAWTLSDRLIFQRGINRLERRLCDRIVRLEQKLIDHGYGPEDGE